MQAKLKDGTIVTIRDAQSSDYPAIAHLYALPTYASARTFTGADKFRIRFNEEKSFTREDLQHEYLTGRENDGMLLAEIDGRPIGMLAYGAKAIVDKPDGTTDPVPYIGQFSVEESWRGKGVGAILKNEFYARMKEAGFDKVTLDVFTENKNALRMYEEEGFQVVNAAYDFVDLRDLPSIETPGIKIKFAKAGDWETVRDLEAALNPLSPNDEHIYDDTGRHNMDEPAFKDAIANGNPIFIATKDDGTPVGYACMQKKIGNQENRLPKTLGDIYNLAAENAGTFKAIISAAGDFARNNGITSIRTYAVPGEQKAELLEDVGFRKFRQFMVDLRL